MEIKNIKELVAPKLGANKKISDIEITESLAKGYGSIMLKVKLTVKDHNNKQELLHLVAKKIPASEYIRESFSIQETFKKEVAFYEVILPLLIEFQKEENFADNFAEFYGVRYNLKESSDIVDEDAVLLLEDLSVKGFGNMDRVKGFDLHFSEKILQDLAMFHGTVIAFKQKKPDVFEKQIRPYCTPFIFKYDKFTSIILNTLRELLQTFPECSHLAEKATNFQEKETPTTCRESFGTIIHFDLWVNNILNKIDENGEIKNTLVDFQLYGYRSAAADVLFFLWTSVEYKVLKENLDHLLHHYHNHLVNTLKRFGIDTSMFEYNQFEEELRLEAEFEFRHAFIFKFFTSFVMEEVDENFTLTLDQIGPELREFFHYMVTECANRGWLY